jgi:hypothetical protein
MSETLEEENVKKLKDFLSKNFYYVKQFKQQADEEDFLRNYQNFKGQVKEIEDTVTPLSAAITNQDLKPQLEGLIAKIEQALTDVGNNTYAKTNQRFYLNNAINNLLQQIEISFPNLSGGKSATSKSKKSAATYTKTSAKVKVGKRECVVYEGKRGGKYVRMNNEYVSVKKALQSKSS